MEEFDGNAIAGLLFAVFGREMTTATATCGNCGEESLVVELGFYLQAPGTVARCRHCGNVVMVFVQARGITCVDLRGLRALEPSDESPAMAVAAVRMKGET